MHPSMTVDLIMSYRNDVISSIRKIDSIKVFFHLEDLPKQFLDTFGEA
jgi:hypothetical protein